MAQNTKKQQKHANNSKPVASVKDLDDEDVELEEEDEEAEAEEGEPSMSRKDINKLPPAKRVAVRVGREVDRVQRQVSNMKHWTGTTQESARGKMEQAEALLRAAAEELVTVPDDWRPTGSRKGGGESKEITPGMRVRITDKRYPEYQEAITPECARGMLVEQLLGNRIKCKTSDGEKLFFPRGHVTIDHEATVS